MSDPVPQADPAAVRRQVREADRLRPREEMQGAMQAGARRYPEPPFPKQAADKEGLESGQALAPLYDAPFYRGSGKLEDRQFSEANGTFTATNTSAVARCLLLYGSCRVTTLWSGSQGLFQPLERLYRT